MTEHPTRPEAADVVRRVSVRALDRCARRVQVLRDRLDRRDP